MNRDAAGTSQQEVPGPSLSQAMRLALVAQQLGRRQMRLQPWRYLVELVAGLAATGHEVRLFTDATADAARVQGCITEVLPSVRGISKRSAIAQRINAFRPDAVLWAVAPTSSLHTWPPRRPGVANVAVLGTPIYTAKDAWAARPVIVTEPTALAMPILTWLLPDRLVATYLARYFDHTLVLGARTMRRLTARGLDPARITVVPPGRERDLAPVVAQASRRDDVVEFLYAGNPLAVRGTRVLLRALALASARAPNARLVMLLREEREGLRQETHELRMMAQSLGLERCVEIISGNLSRPEFAERVRQTDVVVLPFLLVPAESPLFVIEALGMGKPLVTTRAAGIPDVAGPAAWFVPPNDARELAEALVRLSTDAELRKDMAARSASAFEHHPTWQEVIRAVERVLLTAGEPVGRLVHDGTQAAS